ncbi:hypothetical protein MMC09_007059 [Bachmanniomyces sp. S44760]|nr:hypothetical protein [Bachmanniomyces sp. S44760]
MAQNKAEKRLLTLYADVHYYFSAPNPRPLQHRFDKASYVYLYEDGERGRGRLEIANNAGKPEQDAFTGYLDAAKLSRSHKHPNLCTVVVDGAAAAPHGTSSPPQGPGEEHHWRLPSADPRDEGRYLFRLHTLDIYFWTAHDAESFIGQTQRMLRQEQIEILDAPPAPAPHRDAMSPVVQQLESIAVTDPAFHNGQTRSSAPTATTSPQPPIPKAPETHKDATSPAPPGDFKPLAYNPAAPAAPEFIKHREKTPPPPDNDVGTGLAAAAYMDHHHAQVPQVQGGSFPPPPPGQPPHGQALGSTTPMQPPPNQYGSPSSSQPYAPPGRHASSASSQAPPRGQGTGGGSPYSPHPQSAQSYAPPPGRTGSVNRPSPQNSTSFAPPPTNTQSQSYSPGAATLDSPSIQVLGSSYVAPPKQPLQHLQPQYPDYLSSRPHSQSQSRPTDPHQPPVGGYADYNYSQPQQQQHHHHHGQPDYGIHQQVYRPTEEEMGSHGGKKPSAGSAQGKPGKYEEKAEKVEKGVNRFLRKLESKMG